jgi:hypothetical protein
VPDTDRVPAAARVFVVLLIGALLYFGWNAIEKWPFTGWRLYSEIKGDTAGSFFAYRLAPDGSVHAIDYQELPDAYSRAPYLLEKFDRRTEEERERVCDSLANGERGEGREVDAIQIYWERYRVRLVDHERVKDRIERDLRWTCADDDDDRSGEKAQ